MVKASLIIYFKDNNIQLLGNDNIVWYIKDKIKDKINIENILNSLYEYYKLSNKKGKMNVLIIGKDKNELSSIIKKYENSFNFYFEKDLQLKILDFINKND